MVANGRLIISGVLLEMNRKITQLIPFESNGNQMFIEVGKKIPFYNKVIESIHLNVKNEFDEYSGQVKGTPLSYYAKFEGNSAVLVPFDKYLAIYEEIK